MKKYLFLSAIFLLLLGLTACGKQESETTKQCRLALKERVGEDVESNPQYDQWMEDCEAGQGLPK